MVKGTAVLFKIQGKVMFRYTHFARSLLTKFSFTKSVQTRFVAPQKPLIDIFLVIKVIISYDNLIAIDPMKNLGHDLVFLIFTDKSLAGNKNLV